MVPVPASHEDILYKRSFAYVATIDASGVPQVTPIWVGFDGQRILINSTKGRIKDCNLRLNPGVAISVQDPDNPYRYLGVQGRVVEITEEGAADHIHALSGKYRGQPYDLPAGEARAIYVIEPIRT